MAQKTAARLATIDGVEILNSSFFNEFTIRLRKPAAAVVEILAAREILAGVPLSRLFPDQAAAENLLLIATTETNTDDDIEILAEALAGAV
jgi:glycine cleavage system P protein (glycine dehydrogenase) subunit 1